MQRRNECLQNQGCIAKGRGGEERGGEGRGGEGRGGEGRGGEGRSLIVYSLEGLLRGFRAHWTYASRLYSLFLQVCSEQLLVVPGACLIGSIAQVSADKDPVFVLVASADTTPKVDVHCRLLGYINLWGWGGVRVCRGSEDKGKEY